MYVENSQQKNDERVLLAWDFIEEKKPRSQDKEVLLAVLGISGVILAIIAKTYIFAMLLFIATGTGLLLSRQLPRKMSFSIRERSLTIGGRVQSFSEIFSFNVIDDPGDKSRLILKVKNILDGTIVIPLYDHDSDTVKSHLRSRGLREESTLRPSLVDIIARHF